MVGRRRRSGKTTRKRLACCAVAVQAQQLLPFPFRLLQGSSGQRAATGEEATSLSSSLGPRPTHRSRYWPPLLPPPPAGSRCRLWGSGSGSGSGRLSNPSVLAWRGPTSPASRPRPAMRQPGLSSRGSRERRRGLQGTRCVCVFSGFPGVEVTRKNQPAWE